VDLTVLRATEGGKAIEDKGRGKQSTKSTPKPPSLLILAADVVTPVG
jgi:hypothetical protein